MVGETKVASDSRLMVGEAYSVSNRRSSPEDIWDLRWPVWCWTYWCSLRFIELRLPIGETQTGSLTSWETSSRVIIPLKIDQIKGVLRVSEILVFERKITEIIICILLFQFDRSCRFTRSLRLMFLTCIGHCVHDSAGEPVFCALLSFPRILKADVWRIPGSFITGHQMHYSSFHSRWSCN